MSPAAAARFLGPGFHGLSCCWPSARLPIACPRRSLAVFCKIRRRNLSSTDRTRQTKKISTEDSPLNQPLGDENCEVQNGRTDSISNSDQEDLSSADADNGLTTEGDTPPSYEGEKIIVAENTDAGQQLTTFGLEDLIYMIKNAEKNILLLNQARVRTLQDLNKILSEKEALQAEMNILQMKLVETDARVKVSAQQKINVELLESELVKLKDEISSVNTTVGGMHGAYEYSFNANKSLAEELSLLRKENVVLMDGMEILKAKLSNVSQTEERVLVLEKERNSLDTAIRQLKSKFAAAEEDVSKLSSVKFDYKTLWEKVEDMQPLLDNATKQADQALSSLQLNQELQKRIDKLEASFEEATTYKISSNKFQYHNELLQQKVKLLEEHLKMSDQEIHSHIKLYQESVREFQETLTKLKEQSTKKTLGVPLDDMPWEFWSRVLLTIDSWLLEKKIPSNDAKLLREMAWKKNAKIRDAYLASLGKNEHESVSTFLKLILTRTSPGLHIIHIAAEMAPVAKVGGLADVVSGLTKQLQRKGHLVEIVLPKYDCMMSDQITDLKVLDTTIQSYFDGQLYNNKVWVGTVEGLPVYFIEPHHPDKFFWRGQFYGEHDDFKRFSFFSRAALELIYQAGKKPDIIHCHDWQTAFVAPLYWNIYVTRGFNSARICFTCHNFEYQGTAPASELASCGLDVHHLHRPDRMQDNSAHDKVNPLKGGIVFSNIVTTVSPTYAQEARTAKGVRGLGDTLNFHSKKFVGILNGIDTEAWNPSTDTFLRYQYNADDLQGKADNKYFIRKYLKLSSADACQPMVGCITRLVPQKGVHLIRHAIYRTLELGGQFVLLGSSPVSHIQFEEMKAKVETTHWEEEMESGRSSGVYPQREFEGIASHFQNHPDVRLLLKYDEALSHLIYAASDMFVIPSVFEPCGLTQMIAMRYGSVPIARKTGGLNDSVFDSDDNTIPVQYRNGFTFERPDEQGLSGAMERAFDHYMRSPESWQQLVQKDMRIDFSWESSAALYEELYEKSVVRARAAALV